MATKVQLTGGAFQDSEGNVLANGYLRMYLNQDASIASTASVCSGIYVQITLDSSGNVVASQSVWGNDQLLPANTYYRVYGYTASGQLAWGPNNQQVIGNGGTFNVGTWVPNQVVSWTPPLSAVTLQTNEVNNGTQGLLDLHAGSGITLADNGAGRVTITNSGSSSAGSLSGSISLFASQGSLANLNLSTEGTLDWFASVNSISGVATQSQPAKGGTSLSGSLRKSFLMTGLGATVGATGGSGLTMSSNAADSSGNALGATAGFESIGVGNNPTWLNWGCEIEAPASSTSVRNLNVYIPAINGTNGNSVTFKVRATLSDNSATEVLLTQVQTDTNQAVTNVYKANFQFQSAVAGAKLRVQVFVTAFTGSMQFVTTGMQCATLF